MTQDEFDVINYCDDVIFDDLVKHGYHTADERPNRASPGKHGFRGFGGQAMSTDIRETAKPIFIEGMGLRISVLGSFTIPTADIPEDILKKLRREVEV